MFLVDAKAEAQKGSAPPQMKPIRPINDAVVPEHPGPFVRAKLSALVHGKRNARQLESANIKMIGDRVVLTLLSLVQRQAAATYRQALPWAPKLLNSKSENADMQVLTRPGHTPTCLTTAQFSM